MLDEKHNDILTKYYEMWRKVKNLKGKDFDVEVIHEDKDLIKVCTKGLMNFNYFLLEEID